MPVERARDASPLAGAVQSAVRLIRGLPVIIDSDLAALYDVSTKRLNEQVRRNANRFGEAYVFQLTAREFTDLKSQSATSKGRGGRRHRPWAFTEHGVVMAATVIDSERAIAVTQFIIDVFLHVKRQSQRVADDGQGTPATRRFSISASGIGARLQQALNNMLDTVIDAQTRSTVREEAQTIIHESIQHLKDRLQRQGLENDEIAARVTKLLAEAEREKATAAKTRAEADALEFATVIRKLRLLLEAQRAVEHDRVDEFLVVLKQMEGDHEA